jgi:Tfp pilus assembly protein PilO
MNTVIPIILIIVSLAAFFLYIDPMYTGNPEKKEVGIKQLLKDKEKINFQTDKIRQIQKKKRELEKDYRALNASNENALDNLLKMIPDTMENARLVNYIYTIKKRSFISGMSDLRITTDQEDGAKRKNGKIVIKKEKDYKSVNLSFSFTSDYKNFVKFINDLYKSLRIIDIVSISFAPDKKVSDDLTGDKFKFNIVIRTY